MLKSVYKFESVSFLVNSCVFGVISFAWFLERQGTAQVTFPHPLFMGKIEVQEGD